MTIFRSEEALVGLLCLLLVPWIAWTVQRGLRADRLPIGRGYVARSERPGAFRALLAFYVAAAGMMTFISVDLLTDGRAGAHP